MTRRAFILSTVDDLDAKIQQIRQHIADDDTEGPFTATTGGWSACSTKGESIRRRKTPRLDLTLRTGI